MTTGVQSSECRTNADWFKLPGAELVRLTNLDPHYFEKLPNGPTVRQHGAFINVEGIERQKAIRGQRCARSIAIATGLRISEVLALRWESLNFDAGTMLVERAVVNGLIGPTKTETSKDEVPLDGELASILLEWRQKQDRKNGLGC
jgi:integrase